MLSPVEAQSSLSLYHQCKRSFDTAAQVSFVCRTHLDLFPILKFAEVVAREECERQFSKQEWNCTGFSLLKAPNVTRQGKIVYILIICLRILVEVRCLLLGASALSRMYTFAVFRSVLEFLMHSGAF